MCGITGWIDWNKNLTSYPQVIDDMVETLVPRGPDARGTWITKNCALGHRRLCVIDPENGAQPMIRKMASHDVVIVYNGEIYNAPELRKELQERGHRFQTHCDTEVLLVSYIEWGNACVDKLNGIFAFAIWDGSKQTLFLARDRVGVKPLFFSAKAGTFLFASEPKAILAHPSFEAVVSADGLAELFVVGPARTPGHGIFQGMEELKPGCFMTVSPDGINIKTYWRLQSRRHEHDVEETARQVYLLLKDTVERQLISDVPVCTLLSGGLDSSALSAFAANYYRETGKGALETYSVDYVDNDKHFQSSVFQPNSDAPWIKKMSDFLDSNHHYVQFDTPDLVDALKWTMRARDIPGMVDVDASLLLFCREIKKGATVAISGEAADEVFGGYPWFHRKESLEADTFPWSLKVPERAQLLSKEMSEWIDPEKYVAKRYEEALAEVPRLQGESPEEARMREISYLNITRFMPTLLDRKDRMSMAVGLEVRVPFCDHRLIDYVFNIPWEIKTAGDREKGILRKALRGLLPEEIITRKKSPYPKTHNPSYLKATRGWLLEILGDSSSPLKPLINQPLIRDLAEKRYETNFHWFSQLMATPQLFAYLALIDTWLREYKISIR